MYLLWDHGGDWRFERVLECIFCVPFSYLCIGSMVVLSVLFLCELLVSHVYRGTDLCSVTILQIASSVRREMCALCMALCYVFDRSHSVQSR